MRKHMNIDVNGDNMTVREILAEFFGAGTSNVANYLADESLSARLNSLDVTHDLDRIVRGGDFLSAFPTRIVEGGVRGERRLAAFRGIIFVLAHLREMPLETTCTCQL